MGCQNLVLLLLHISLFAKGISCTFTGNERANKTQEKNNVEKKVVQKELIKDPGSLTSLLYPEFYPAGFEPPSFSQSEKKVAQMLKDYRQGISRISYRRDIGKFDGVELGCGFGYMNPYFTQNYVAVGPDLFANGLRCGLCIELWCVDSICPQPFANSSTFLVADRCDTCENNDIIVSFDGIQQLTSVDADINPQLQIAFKFTACNDLIKGPVLMLPSPSNSRQRVAINFSNVKVPVKAAIINNMRMMPSENGQFVIEDYTSGAGLPLRPPYVISIQSVLGEVLTLKTTELRPQSFPENFEEY